MILLMQRDSNQTARFSAVDYCLHQKLKMKVKMQLEYWLTAEHQKDYWTFLRMLVSHQIYLTHLCFLNWKSWNPQIMIWYYSPMRLVYQKETLSVAVHQTKTRKRWQENLTAPFCKFCTAFLSFPL